MCGISGFSDRQLFGNKNLIQKFQKILNHRGPDFTNYYEHNPLTIISNRLSILDLTSKGNQPMFSSSGRYAMVYNGEIYNYRDLNNKYLNQYKFKSTTDTETILELIENFGVIKTCNLLDGMFSIALLDKQNDKLILFRDRNGQKPLYYYKLDNSFSFSSEIKLFKYYPNFKQKISEIGEKLYLKFGYIKYPYTIYQNVFKLDPNYFLELDLKTNTFSLNELYKKQKNNFKKNNNLDQLKNKFEYYLNQSVNKHLISDKPLGCFLSGGIDSSLVTYFANKNNKNKLHTFNIQFENNDYDESENAKQIANYIGTDHHTLLLNEDKFFQIVKNITKYLDEPFADTSLIPTIFMCQESKKYVDVVLTGDGSDEFFLGYNRYKYLNKLIKYMLPINLHIRKLLKKLLLNLKPNFIKFIFRIIPIKFTKRDYENFTKFISILDSKSKDEIFFNIIADNEFFLFPKYKSIFKNKNDYIESVVNYDQNIYLIENGMTKIDRSSMYFSLETRSPFLSNTLTEFANNISINTHTNYFKDLKIIPKKLFEKLLGKQKIQKYKTGFSVPPDLFFNKKIKEIIISKCNIYKELNSHKINDNLFKKFIDLYLNNQSFDINLWKIYIYQSWLENEK